MLLTGILFLIPIGVTYWFLALLVRKTQGWTRPLVDRLVRQQFGPDQSWIHDLVLPAISILLVILFVMAVGALANFYIGKKVLALVDRLMLQLPIVRGIYGGTKQIIEAFSIQKGARSFKTVVMLEYPRRECWVLGFLTNEELAESRRVFGQDLVAVFVPSTPNPTTGFLLYLKPDDLFVVDITVEEAVKLIVSAGIVVPPSLKKPPVRLADLEQPAEEYVSSVNADSPMNSEHSNG